MGINWDLAPRIDCLMDVTEPLDASKTFGDDAEIIATHALAFSQGLRAAGIVSCATEALASSIQQAHRRNVGMTELDPEELQEIAERELSALRRLDADQCLDSIMLASSGYDADSDPEYAQDAKSVIGERLRTSLNFQGPVIFDSSSYDVGTWRMPSVMRALLAGADMVILPGNTTSQLAMVKAIYATIQASILPVSTISASAARVIALKSQHLSWPRALQPPGPLHLSSLLSTNASLSRTAYRASTTMFPSSGAFTPLPTLPPSSLLLLLTPAVPPLSPRSTTDPFEPLGRHLNTLHPTLRIRHVPYTLSAGLTSTHTAFLRRADAILLVLCNNSSAFVYSLLEFVEMVMAIWAERERDGYAGVVVGAGDPRDLSVVGKVLGGRVGGVLCYEYTRGALEAVAEVVMGRREARGRVPVRMG